MSPLLSPQILSRISDLISSQMGLHFPEERWRDLAKSMEQAASDAGFKDVQTFVTHLRSAPQTRKDIEILASRLTVGETYFFRDKESLEAMAGHVFPELIRSRSGSGRYIRIWSAGCCTGEEPYSIAILLTMLIPDIEDWNITILATDINPGFLKKAREGVYTEWSFRGAPAWLKESYFKKRADGRYCLIPRIKNMVAFSYLNLAEDAYPSLLGNTNAMDVILCRNVLMYFSPDRAAKVITGLHHSIVDRGWLIVSPAEATKEAAALFSTVYFPGAILYRKETHAPALMHSADELMAAMQAALIKAADTEISRTGEETEQPQPTAAQITAAVPAAEEKEKEHAMRQQRIYAMINQGLYAEAAVEIASLPEKEMKASDAAAWLARILANHGRRDEAVKWCKKAIESDTLNPGHYYLLALIQQEDGRLEEAARLLKKAIYLDHNLVVAYFVMGSIMSRLGRTAQSKKYFSNASELLASYGPDDIIPESDGITAQRLSEIIAAMR